MVIDKSTGRGCALSIASKTISRQLIEDGIIGKPLLRKPRKQGYDLVRIVDKRGYYMNTNRQQVDELVGEPLWVPSFIDSKQWERSVGQFTTLSPLDSNVEKFLLPYMDDYKKVLIISSSPRKGGNSETLAEAFAKGAQEADNQVETVYI